MDEDLKLEIDAAVKVLKDGGVILYPTDTIWGLGCDATNEDAVKRIFDIKQRADSKSLITLVSGVEMLERYVEEVPEMAYTLVDVNDKPMTIIYPKGVGLAPNVVAEDGSAAIRIPMSQFCIELIKRFEKPIVSTSANISGDEPAIDFEDVNAEIIDCVDWMADPMFDEEATGEASQIIKLGLTGEVQVIR
jgi:L-threonylcarbamoyladenylate synthase